MKKIVVLLLITIGFASASFFAVARKNKQLVSAFKYRFPASAGENGEAALQTMEERVKKLGGDPIDLGTLSSMYVRQARTTGDFTYYDKAEAIAHLSLAKMSNPAALMTLAKVAEARHQFPESIKLSEKAMSEKSTTGALGLLVTSHLAMGNEGEAARYADELIEKSPCLESYLLRALAFAAEGRDEESLFDFQHALQIEDLGEAEESARARTLMARFLLKHGKNKEARVLLEEALKIIPNYHLALDWLAESDAKEKNFVQAEKEILQAFGASKQIVYLTHYARVKAQEGDTAVAEETWAQAEKMLRGEIQSGSYGHRLELVRLILDRGKKNEFPEAFDLAQKEVKTRSNPESYGLLARSFALLGSWKPAGAAISAALRSGVHDAELYYWAGRIAEGGSNFTKANFYFDLALQTDRTDSKVKTALSQMKASAKQAPPLKLSQADESFFSFF